MVWGDGPALFDMLIFIFKIYIYALEVLQRQGEVETPRVLFGAAVIVDLGLGMHKRGTTCLSNPKHSIDMCSIQGNTRQEKNPQSI